MKMEKLQSTPQIIQPYNEILFSNKNEQHIVAHNNLDESQRQYAEWKKPVSRGYKLYNSICMTVYKRQNHKDGDYQWIQRLEEWEVFDNKYVSQRSFWSNEAIIYSECCGDYANLCMCGNSQNCTPENKS